MLEFIGGGAFEVPFPDQPGLVSLFAKFPGIDPLLAVPLGAVPDHSVGFAVLAGQNGRPAGATDRIDVERMSEERPFLGNPVEVGTLIDRPWVRSDGAQGMIVTKEKENVGSAISQGKACKK